MTFLRLVQVFILFLFTSTSSLSAAASPWVENGKAYYYHYMAIEGRVTTSGEIFSNSNYTCSHRSLRYGTILKITRLDNGKSVLVRVNDRGSIEKDCIINISKAAANDIGLTKIGKTRVKVEVVGKTTASRWNDYMNSGGTTALAIPKPRSYEEIFGSNKTPSSQPQKRELYRTKISHTETFNTSYSIPNHLKGYSIQVGAFTRKYNAEHQKKVLQQLNVEDVYIWKVESKGIYRVIIAPFQSYDKCQQQAKVLKNKYDINGIIKRLN